MTNLQEILTKANPDHCPLVWGSNEWYFPQKMMPVNFPFGNNWKRGISGRGVYLIGDFYVGISEQIKVRCKDHLAMFRRGQHSDEFSEAVYRYAGKKLPVFYLSDDITQEYNYAVYLKEMGLPLVNDITKCKGYGVVCLQRKIEEAISFLQTNGYIVQPKQQVR